MSERLTVYALVFVAQLIRHAGLIAPALLVVATVSLALDFGVVAPLAACAAAIVTALSLGYLLGRLGMPR